jgi:cytochrome P450
MASDIRPDYAEKLRNFSIYDEATVDLLDDVMDYARQTCPVAQIEVNEGYYLVSRYEHIRTALADTTTFSSRDGISQPVRQLIPMPPINSDPPEHNDFRRLLNRFFSKAGLAASEGAIRMIARSLIDGFIDRGEVELMSEFATPLTSATLCRVILNLDDQALTDTAVHRVEAISASNDANAWSELTGFLSDLMAAHAGSTTDNVLTTVLNGTVAGRPLTSDEKLGILVILFLGGLDTTRAAIAAIVGHLVQQPGLEERLRDPGWVTRDLDEFLRHDTVVTALARTVTRDTELGGQALRAGDRVVLHYYSANHDPAQFDNADRLDFERQRNPHLAFGVGIHRCIGSNLARLSIRVAFDELLSRVQNIRLADGADLRKLPGLTRMHQAMPIEFDRRPDSTPRVDSAQPGHGAR